MCIRKRRRDDEYLTSGWFFCAFFSSAIRRFSCGDHRGSGTERTDGDELMTSFFFSFIKSVGRPGVVARDAGFRQILFVLVQFSFVFLRGLSVWSGHRGVRILLRFFYYCDSEVWEGMRGARAGRGNAECGALLKVVEG